VVDKGRNKRVREMVGGREGREIESERGEEVERGGK